MPARLCVAALCAAAAILHAAILKLGNSLIRLRHPEKSKNQQVIYKTDTRLATIYFATEYYYSYTYI